MGEEKEGQLGTKIDGFGFLYLQYVAFRAILGHSSSQ